MRPILFLSMLSFLSACSAHSPMIVKTTTDFASSGNIEAKRAGKSATPAASIVVSSEKFSGSTNLGQIDVGTVWYGSCTKAYKQMARKAAEVGANAVEDATCWKQPSGFSWASPHAKGQAVIVSSSQLKGVANLQNGAQ